MSDLDDLRAARDLIADPEHWTRGSFARSKTGAMRALSSTDACKFCASGAFAKAIGSDVFEAAAILAQLLGVDHMPSFNDGGSHAEVLAKFDEAIARLEAEN